MSRNVRYIVGAVGTQRKKEVERVRNLREFFGVEFG